ncbi:MAG: neutral/alkaline non-lysosomal ceramidase N-terminal domain-containing protein [Deferribacteres bacterium]|nr:neutral/alkaline non-lysosomal ceramidase N-terminal domain-containing protein [candidate division KSB1 bacterium]MCB9500606.1 neutral/alkaline non-lysosomal ceramidase N-terminal domain-containing protein [Deferribacteres bacterium]
MKNIVKSWLKLCLIPLFVPFFASAIQASEIAANCATVDLTPPLEMQFALGGYGERMSKPAEGIHDRIWAKALVLHQGAKKYAIVTLDVLALPSNVKPQLVQRLAATEWTEENILLLPSHCHTSLDMTALNDKNLLKSPQIGIFQPELLEFVLNSLVKLIKDADTNLEPVRIGTGRITLEVMNRNRRKDPAVDRYLTVTRIDFMNGKPLAILVNWTAHPTFMDEKDMFVSAGWPGYLQRELQQWIGDDITAMYYNGAEGDQAPVGKGGASHYEKAEIYGRAMAVQSYKLYNLIEPVADVELEFNSKILALPKRRVHPLFMETGGEEYNLTPEALEAVLNVMSPASTRLNAVRIGDLLIVGVPGEMAAGLGLEIKGELRQKGIKFPVIGGLANEWISYILTAEQYNNGAGYESSVSFYGEELGQIIRESALAVAVTLIRK